MKPIAQDIIKQKEKDYRACLNDGKYDQALGLVLVATGALRLALMYRKDSLISAILGAAERVFSLPEQPGHHNTIPTGPGLSLLERIPEEAGGGYLYRRWEPI